MQLNFLGIGAAYYPPFGSTSAYFVVQGHFYLIDCGETVFSALWNNHDLNECKDIYVLITHLHADHIGSLGSFISYSVNILKKTVTIITPDKTITTVLSLTGLQKDSYVLLDSFVDCFPGNIKIIPHVVPHDSFMQCYGYMLSDTKEWVYYGGDCYGIPSDILLGLQNGTIRRAYQEVTYEEGDHGGHSSLEQLCNIVPAEVREKVFCIHLGGNFISAVLNAGFRVAERVSGE